MSSQIINVTIMPCSLANRLCNMSKRNRDALIAWLQGSYKEPIERILERALPGYAEHEGEVRLYADGELLGVIIDVWDESRRRFMSQDILGALTEEQIRTIEDQVLEPPEAA